MVSPAYCQLCGRELTRRGKVYHHPKWPPGRDLKVCADCAQTRPRCRVCGLPQASQPPHGICPVCSAEIPTCLACGRPVTGAYLEINGVGPYCESCYHTRPPCDVCAAPLTDQRWLLSDGRVSCSQCHAQAVYAPAEAAALYDELKDILASLLGLALNVPTGLALVDRNQLAEIIRQQSNGAPAEELDAEHTLGLYARRGMRRGIYVQSGLPRPLLLQIAAHEFGHAWQGENCPLLREPLLHEGFAEWIAYKVMGHYGYERQQRRMVAREDLYGQGLRRILEFEASLGPAGVIEGCRTAR